LGVASLAKMLLLLGPLITLLGLCLYFGERFGLGRLPGDFLVRGKNFTLSFPLASSLVLSVVLTVVLNLLFRGR
jgi:Protein of unknown function (DUF2905)